MIDKIKKTFFVVGLSTCLLSTTAIAKNPYFNDARETVSYYLDLITSGNIESAEGLWLPASLEQATRLGIEYDGIKFKPDCMSPAVYNMDAYTAGVPSGIDSQAEINDTTLRFRFILDVPSMERAGYPYYVTRTGGYFWLAYPHNILAADWPVKETKYFAFHIAPEKMSSYNDVAGAALDHMIEKMAAYLKIDDKRLAELAEKKIIFYLCRNSSDVEKLANGPASGTYRYDADVIFSTFLINPAPVADLMINYKLQRLPYHSDNFMRSGLRACLSGGWQRSPEVLLDFGEYILKYNLIELDTLMQATFGEDNNMTDIAEPAQACFSEYLVQRFGIEDYLNCFTQLSSMVIPEDSLKNRIVKGVLATALGVDWENIVTGLTEFVSETDRHGGPIYPGEEKTDRVLIDKNGVKISASKKWIQIDYKGGTDNLFNIGIVFGKDPRLVGISSSLMAEQYQDPELYDGYRYGIRFDKNEIGLYDYAVNRLVAKYVTSFDPSDKYYDPNTNAVKAYFDMSLLGETPPDMGDAIFIQ